MTGAAQEPLSRCAFKRRRKAINAEKMAERVRITARMLAEGASQRDIAKALLIGKSTVPLLIAKARAAEALEAAAQAVAEPIQAAQFWRLVEEAAPGTRIVYGVSEANLWGLKAAAQSAADAGLVRLHWARGGVRPDGEPAPARAVAVRTAMPFAEYLEARVRRERGPQIVREAVEQGLRADELADRLGISVSAARRRIQKVRAS